MRLKVIFGHPKWPQLYSGNHEVINSVFAEVKCIACNNFGDIPGVRPLVQIYQF